MLNVKMNYTLTTHELFVSAMLGSNANAAIIDLIVLVLVPAIDA